MRTMPFIRNYLIKFPVDPKEPDEKHNKDLI